MDGAVKLKTMDGREEDWKKKEKIRVGKKLNF
jgi:hypothetical protein